MNVVQENHERLTDTDSEDLASDVSRVSLSEENTLPNIKVKLNIIDKETYMSLGSPLLRRGVMSTLVPYGGGKPITVMGQCDLVLETKKVMDVVPFVVVPGKKGNLLGYKSSTQLGLVKIIKIEWSLQLAGLKEIIPNYLKELGS